MNPKTLEAGWLTGALEDYLETIYLQVRDLGFARVRDIAKARKVKASSVTPALKRLAEQGLVRYVQREYVGLTEQGEKEARRVLARHDLLTRFFSDILRMSPQEADREACAIEHCLSAEGMSRMVRFFEFLSAYPETEREWMEKFHCYAQNQGDSMDGEASCAEGASPADDAGGKTVSLSDLKPGQDGKIKQVSARGAIRQRLLDMGLLPEVVVRVERVAPVGDPVWISLQGSQIALRRREAEMVLVSAG